MQKNKSNDLHQLKKENEFLSQQVEELKLIGNQLKKYEFIGNASGDFMTLINRNYVYEAVNDTYLREHKLKRDDVIGKTMPEVWGEDIFNMSLKQYVDACFSGRKLQYQAWFKFSADEENCYDVTYYPYSEIPDGPVTHVTVITHNITAQKTTELALRDSEQRFRGIAEGSFDMIFILDTKGKFTYVSPACKRISGYHPEELIGKNFKDFFSDYQASSLKETYLRIIKGEKIEARHLLMKTNTDEPAIIEINGLANLKNDKIENYQGIVRDITLRLKLERRQRDLELQLIKEHKLSSIGILVSGLAHNINNPLTAIYGAVDIINMKYSDPSEIEIIKEGAERIRSIVNNLMTKCRKEQQENLQNIDLNELLKTELEFLLADSVFKHDILKEYSFAKKITPIKGVYSDFSQGLLNIVRNSIDAMYTSKSKKFFVGTEQKDGTITITMRDTGCGIPEENIPKLFDPFFSTKPTMSETDVEGPRGTGLGLYSTHQLLSPYGAKIDISSEVGVGTEFKIKIPVNTKN